MKKITRSMTVAAAGLGLAGFLALGATLPAHADNGVTPSFTVAAGSDSAAPTSIADLIPVVTGQNAGKLTGSALVFTSSLQIGTITDNSGSGAGWSLTLALGAFTGATSPDVLLPGSLTSTDVTVVSGTANGVSSDATTSGLALDTDSTVGGATASTVTLASASGTTGTDGMGTAAFTSVPLTLTVPALAHADTYTASGTVTFVASNV